MTNDNFSEAIRILKIKNYELRVSNEDKLYQNWKTGRLEKTEINNAIKLRANRYAPTNIHVFRDCRGEPVYSS